MVCGIKVDGGAGRCPAHKVGGARLRSCRVCSGPSQGEYCRAHEPKIDEATRNARNPYRKAYKSADYARNRQHRFEKARGRCESCGQTVNAGGWDCHHMIDIKDGGTNDLDNLRILCNGPGSCHNRITAFNREQRRLGRA